MADQSLGEMLRAQNNEKAECLQALERRALEKGDVTQRDLLIVKDFFHQASTKFTSDILAQVEVQPLVLGNGENVAAATILRTCRWKKDYDVRCASHPYNPVWKPFKAWCDNNELEPVIECRHDRGMRETWYILTVTPLEPTSKIEPPPTDVKTCGHPHIMVIH